MTKTVKDYVELLADIWRQLGQPNVDDCYLIVSIGHPLESRSEIFGLPIKLSSGFITPRGNSIMLAGGDDWETLKRFDQLLEELDYG